jgi:hypothetical protein
MNEIYIVNGQKFDVAPNRKEEFLKKYPKAILDTKQIIPEKEGKTTPTTPGAVVEETAAPDMDSKLENTSLDSQEISNEEKRKLPFLVRNRLSTEGTKFTKKNVDLALENYKTIQERPISEAIKKDIAAGKKDISVAKQSFSNRLFNFLGDEKSTPFSLAIGATSMYGPFAERIARSPRLQSAVAGITYAAADLLDETGIDFDKAKKAAITADIEAKKRMKKTTGITDAPGPFSFFESLLGAGVEVGYSVATGAATAGTMPLAELAGNIIADYNLTKAVKQYPNLSEEEAIYKLIDTKETEIWTPLAFAVPAIILERLGLKAATKAATLAALKPNAKNISKSVWLNSNVEGRTEYFQGGIEKISNSVAEGKNTVQVAADAVDYLFSKEGLENYLQGLVGTGVLGGGGALTREIVNGNLNVRSQINGEQLDNITDEIVTLNQKLLEAKSETVKETILKQIKQKEEELSSLVIKSNGIINFLSDKDYKDINNLEKLKEQQIKNVKKISKDFDDGIIDEQERLDGLNLLKQEYLNAQNRIKGVVSKVSKNANKTAQEAEKLYQQKGKEATAEIIELYRPMAEKLALKRRNVPGFDKQLLTDEILTGKRGILDLINEYNPDKNPGVTLPMYVNKFAAQRAIEASKRILKTEFETDVTEAKGVTDTVTAETKIETKENAQQEVKKALAQDLNLSEDTQNEIVTAVEKTLGTKLPAVTDKGFKPALTKGFRTELTNTLKKVFGRTASYEQFLRDNFEKIYPAIPQETINKKFKEFNEAVVDPKTGKQLRERTAEGKKVFKKRDIAKAEFIKYFLDAPGNVKGARKTSLAEVIADEVGLDNVLDALAKPEVVEKFKAIQELQGQEVPSNFIEIISEKIDRAIDYLDGLQKNNGVLYSSLVIPELSIAAVKAFLKAAKVALKATNSFAKAIKAGIEAAQELFESKQEKDAVASVLTKTYKKAEDLGETVFVEQATENIDRELQKIYIPKAAYKLIENLKQSYTENDFDNIEKIKTFILLHSKAIRTVASPSLFQKQMPSLTTNEQLLKAIEIPKSLQNKKAFNLRKEGGGKSIFFGNEKIASPLSLNSEKNNIIKNPDNYIDRIDNQAARYKELLINEIVRLKTIDANLAKDMLKIMQKDQLSPLRLAGKLGIVFNEGNTINEHNPPIQSIIESIEDFIDDKLSLDSVKKILDNSRQNLVSKEFDKLIPNKFKSKADKARYDKPRKEFQGKYKEYNLPASKSSLDKQFNELLQKTTGTPFYETFSPVKAAMIGKGKGKKFFIPYSADDFVGLLYATLAKGKAGDQQMAWYEQNLLRPFSRGIQQYEAAKQNALRNWQALKKEAKKDVPGGLNKVNSTGFTNQNSVRVYIWQKQGEEINGVTGEEIKDNVSAVKNNPKLLAFAERLIALNPEGYPPPSPEWNAGDITTDLVSYINGVKRSEFLTQWKENANEIFNEENKNKLKALYGEGYIKALENMLYRMEKGRNKFKDASDIERKFQTWVNNSVGAIMFFNARSAVLQTLSAVNFINFSDNNPIAAGLALANFPQYVKDFSTLFNSDFLKQRRTGLQTDVNADEIAKAAATAKNKAQAMMSAVLKFGFTPTQMADSFAIASGGATFYRNRINKYKKEGLEQAEAKAKAFTDFQEIAEETQQSARPDRISMQQAGSLGRLILAFGNTPMQYARLTKKATLDLINGRGDWKTNVSKIAYYSVIQNIIFSALQQGLFALLFDDEEDEEKKSRFFRIGNSSADTLLRGAGVYGAAAATVKNMIIKIIEESEKSRPDYKKLAIEATSISPPINSKLRKLESAGKTFTYKQSKEKVFTEGFSLENPAFLAAGKIISAGTNLPADRVVQKMDHIYTAMQPETELWQGIALSLGWGEWELGMIEKQTKKSEGRKVIKRSNLRRKKINRKVN